MGGRESKQQPQPQPQQHNTHTPTRMDCELMDEGAHDRETGPLHVMGQQDLVFEYTRSLFHVSSRVRQQLGMCVEDHVTCPDDDIATSDTHLDSYVWVGVAPPSGTPSRILLSPMTPAPPAPPQEPAAEPQPLLTFDQSLNVPQAAFGMHVATALAAKRPYEHHLLLHDPHHFVLHMLVLPGTPWLLACHYGHTWLTVFDVRSRRCVALVQPGQGAHRSTCRGSPRVLSTRCMAATGQWLVCGYREARCALAAYPLQPLVCAIEAAAAAAGGGGVDGQTGDGGAVGSGNGSGDGCGDGDDNDTDPSVPTLAVVSLDHCPDRLPPWARAAPVPVVRVPCDELQGKDGVSVVDVYAVLVNEAGDTLYASTQWGDIWVFAMDPDPNVCPSTWPLVDTMEAHTNVIRSIIRTQSYRICTASDDHTVRVWSASRTRDGAHVHELMKTLEGHTNDVNALTTRGDLLISGSDDETVRVWSLATYDQLYLLEHDAVVLPMLWIGDCLWTGSQSIRQWSGWSQLPEWADMSGRVNTLLWCCKCGSDVLRMLPRDVLKLVCWWCWRAPWPHAGAS